MIDVAAAGSKFDAVRIACETSRHNLEHSPHVTNSPEDGR